MHWRLSIALGLGGIGLLWAAYKAWGYEMPYGGLVMTGLSLIAAAFIAL